MRLLYETTKVPEMEYPDSGIFLWHIDDAHASRPRLGLRSGRMLGATYATGDKGNLVEFIVNDPEKWSRAIGEWTTNAHITNAVTDRDVEDAVRRRKEDENKTDITLSPGFFQSISQLGRTRSCGSAESTDKKCGRCENPVNPGSNFSHHAVEDCYDMLNKYHGF